MNTTKKILITFIILSVIFIIILNSRIVNAYGLVKIQGLSYSLDASVIDCEREELKLLIINFPIILNHDNKSILAQGTIIFNTIIINSINDTYNPAIACYEKHESDINPEPLNYDLKTNETTIIRYNVTNNQDQRLFYECRLLTDCTLERKYYTEYINPGETHDIYFHITCNTGNHNSTIQTIFIDEFSNQHTILQEIIINSN